MITQKRLLSGARKAFTMIEVLIVMSIAGLILIIVFLAVPAAQRNYRNTDRKHIVSFVGAQLEAYAATTGSYPVAPDQFCSFIEGYLKERMPGMQSCSPSLAGGKDCVVVQSDVYSVCYHDRTTSSHAYLGPLDEISIQGGHWCNTDPVKYGEPAAHAITSGTSGDADTKRYVVWTILEGTSQHTCVDSYPAY